MNVAGQKVAVEVEVAFALAVDRSQKIQMVKSLLTLDPLMSASRLAGDQTPRYQTPLLLDM
jgi:hypothetical protein